jgi:hypothetical protein
MEVIAMDGCATPGSGELVEAALRAAARGWPVFPLRPYSKLPAVRDWERRASADPTQVRAWWSASPVGNIGLACGPAGLAVIDLDAGGHGAEERERMPHGRDALIRLAAAAGEPIPATYTVATPSGEHLYFAAPESSRLRNTAGALGWHIDTRAAGGYVVAAGSVLRIAGAVRRYRVLRDMAVAPLPRWLAAALKPAPTATRFLSTEAAGSRGAVGDGPALTARMRAYVDAAVDGEVRAVAEARPGTRNYRLFRAAANLGELLGAGLLDEASATDALLAAAVRHVGVEGFTEGEARRTVSNGLRRGRGNPRRLTA